MAARLASPWSPLHFVPRPHHAAKKDTAASCQDARDKGKRKAVEHRFAQQVQDFDELTSSWYSKYAALIERRLPYFKEHLQELATRWLAHETAQAQLPEDAPQDWDALAKSSYVLPLPIWRHVAVWCAKQMEVYAEGDVERVGPKVSWREGRV